MHPPAWTLAEGNQPSHPNQFTKRIRFNKTNSFIFGSLFRPTVAKKRKTEPSGFGIKLKQIREAAEMTQSELGEACDMAYQAIARLERGENEPSWPTVLKLAKALRVDPNRFMPEHE